MEDCEKKIKNLEKNVKEIEINCFLSGENDELDIYMEIHAGAGGTESQDWADMLRRMYLKWFDKKGFNYSVISEHKGEEAGIKSSTLKVTGKHLYGFMKNESGVHRLVRISPFDSNSRRHTSFAAVFIFPIVSDDIDISISDSDLRIDTYRASGAGGQHVNKTDSAVRITHLETGIVVQCQNQRSQLKNKNIALKILTSKLYQLKKDELNNHMSKINESKSDIAWGNQIRSYVFHPYNMVKDHRTKHETSNINAVLDGDIDSFIRQFLLFNLENLSE